MDWMPKDGTFLHYTIDDFPVRIVCCDSVRVDEVTGGLCAERQDWLNRTLAEAPDKPTIVAMHHPPFGSGMTGTTSNGLVEGVQNWRRYYAGTRRSCASLPAMRTGRSPVNSAAPSAMPRPQPVTHSRWRWVKSAFFPLPANRLRSPCICGWRMPVSANLVWSRTRSQSAIGANLCPCFGKASASYPPPNFRDTLPDDLPGLSPIPPRSSG